MLSQLPFLRSHKNKTWINVSLYFYCSTTESVTKTDSPVIVLKRELKCFMLCSKTGANLAQSKPTIF